MEPSYNVTAIDALRLTSISMVFMAISFFLLIAVFIVLIILLYIRVRKGEVIQNGIFVNFCCLRVFWGCGFNCVWGDVKFLDFLGVLFWVFH